MIVITPIAGSGTRTQSLGAFKPLIEVDPGRTILHYCVSSLKEHWSSISKYIFICTKDQEKEHGVTAMIQHVFLQWN